MQRVCFVLQVRPDRLEEYKRRHNSVWPEMQQALRETGWGNYSLFLRSDGLLVGYLETDDFNRAREAMARREVNRKWQHEWQSSSCNQMASYLTTPWRRYRKFSIWMVNPALLEPAISQIPLPGLGSAVPPRNAKIEVASEQSPDR